MQTGISSQPGPFYVYVYFDSAGIPFYVGKGTGKRSHAHLHMCLKEGRRQYRTMFYTKLRKMLREDQVFEIDIVVNDVSEDVAFQWERFSIEYWGRRDLKTGCLCNHTDGGEGQTGLVHSEATKQRMREVQTPHLRALAKAQRGIPLNAERRAKFSIAQTGRKHSPESVEKTAAAHRGMKRSAETCRRISEANSNPSEETRAKLREVRSKPIIALDLDTGEECMKFDSALVASRFFGITNVAISNCLCGRACTSAGCVWKYLDESSEVTAQRISKAHKVPSRSAQACKAVIALDPNTCEECMKFDSALAAARFFGLANASGIGNCIAGRVKTAAGCAWRFYEQLTRPTDIVDS